MQRVTRHVSTEEAMVHGNCVPKYGLRVNPSTSSTRNHVRSAQIDRLTDPTTEKEGQADKGVDRGVNAVASQQRIPVLAFPPCRRTLCHAQYAHIIANYHLLYA